MKNSFASFGMDLLLWEPSVPKETVNVMKETVFQEFKTIFSRHREEGTQLKYGRDTKNMYAIINWFNSGFQLPDQRTKKKSQHFTLQINQAVFLRKPQKQGPRMVRVKSHLISPSRKASVPFIPLSR